MPYAVVTGPETSQPYAAAAEPAAGPGAAPEADPGAESRAGTNRLQAFQTMCRAAATAVHRSPDQAARILGLALELLSHADSVDGTSRTGRPPAGLTVRETEVVVLLAEGLTNKQIARRLFISPGTVSIHLGRAYAKLGVSRRAAAAARLLSTLDTASRSDDRNRAP